ncbi:hypothetical protein T492DRAFT_836420 [Pavlovales sp. CCMP2436]|nr:hypothetical protein T492DRAFT_836420 [Pavlovales sp. CCMP2436]
MPVLSRGLLTALAGLALAAPLAGTGAGGSACALADDLLGSSVADFEYGIGGWSAGNSSRWAWQTGCDGTAGPPCAAAGRGYLLAVGEGAQLTSPPVLGYCVSLSYFAQGVEIAVEAVNEAGEATTLATLPQSKGWRVSTSLALPASYARVRLTARAAAGGRWVAQSVGGVDDIGFRLRANPLNDPAALKLPAAFGVPLRPRAVLSPIGVDVSTTFALSPLGLGALPALLSARGIWRAKVFQYEPGLLSALAQGGVREAVVGIPNVELRNLAFSPSHAEKLVGSMEGHRISSSRRMRRMRMRRR